MIDQKYQGQGFGKEAMKGLIKRFQKNIKSMLYLSIIGKQSWLSVYINR